MRPAQNLAAAPASSWQPDRTAGARHFRLYAAANLIDIGRWHEERPHVARSAAELAQDGQGDAGR